MPLRSSAASFRLFGVAALFLVAATAVLYPHFCDAVDPDGTSYLVLARRWARGDWSRAVNGYWSPWGPWLTACGMRLGLAEIPAALVQNTAGALAFLAATLLLFRRLGLSLRQQAWLTAGLAGFLEYAVFAQWFDDLWAGAFLLASLDVLLHPRFAARKGLWVVHGALGALAYFAKAYSLPFFALNTAVCGWWISGGRLGKWIALLLASGGALALVCLPWWGALHARYGFWTTGTAGALNLSWGLLGHPIFVDGPQSLLPPPHPGSLVFWEDPWLVNARTVHPWDSFHLFRQQIIRGGYFTARLFWKASLVSPVLPLLGLAAAWWLFRKRLRRALSLPTRVLAAQFVLFPLGLFLLHSESRYLWYLLPVGLAFGALQVAGLRRSLLLTALVALSFWAEPVLFVPQLWHAGRAEKALAAKLVQAGLRGGFTDSEPQQPSYASCCRIAYFSGVPYWAHAAVRHDEGGTRAGMDRHRIPFVLTGRRAALKAFYPEEQMRYSDRNVTLFERYYPVPTH